MKRWIRIGVFIVCLAACTCLLNSFFFFKKSTPIPKESAQEVYATSLPDVQRFRSYAGAPLVAKYNGVSSIKLIYELKTKKLFYVDSKHFRFHYDFCTNELGFQAGLELFNQTNYSNTKLRKYILANLNYYPNLDVYGLEFVTEDVISHEHVITLYKEVMASSFIKRNLKLFINGDYLKSLTDKLSGIPLLYPNNVYESLSYQMIQPGTAYGKLIFIKDKSDYDHITPDCILVVKGSPIYIPSCQAILSNQFQTPLSHIQILSHNNHIPSLAYKQIWDSSFQRYHQQFVQLKIDADTFLITPIDEKTAKENQQPKKSTATHLTADIRFDRIERLTSFRFKDKNRIGNKAANLATLERLAKENKSLFLTPEGSFAIPFYYYHEHIRSERIQEQINHIVKEHSGWTNSVLKEELIRLRRMITLQPVNPQLIQGVEKKIVENRRGYSYRFRSSSNAEDASGFSGAGIYTSKTGIYKDTTKSIADAIRKVWAGTWSFEAFMAREQANMDHQDVKMAILCHRNFPNEDANGVVVTRNIYRTGFPGYTVNVQVKEISVVQPDSNVNCDQFTVFKPADFNPFSDDLAVDYIVTGNQNNGKQVLTSKQIQQLYKAISVCDDHFAMYYYRGLACDIEFKWEKGTLYLKQIRPYN